jgi:hypothetical protein
LVARGLQARAIELLTLNLPIPRENPFYLLSGICHGIHYLLMFLAFTALNFGSFQSMGGGGFADDIGRLRILRQRGALA